MIPIRDSQRRSSLPAMTLILIGVNVALFVYQLGLGQRELIALWTQWGAIPFQLSRLTSYLLDGNIRVVMTALTAQFLHANWLHILSNMWYLWIFGDNVEERLGGGRFLLLYLASGVIGVYAHSLVNPTSLTPTIGASGAVAGILGAYLVAFPHSRILTLLPLGFFITFTEVPALLFIFIWIALQVANGLGLLVGGAAEAVAWWAHIGGFGAGMLFIALLGGRTGAPSPGGGKSSGRVMGLDLGERRIGVALSDETGLLAQPAGHVQRRGLDRDLASLESIIDRMEVSEIVVGIPFNMDGSEGYMARGARGFAAMLAERWGIPVRSWDERLTSVQAERILLEADLSRRHRRQARDAMAAAIMLQAYLDSRRSGNTNSSDWEE